MTSSFYFVFGCVYKNNKKKTKVEQQSIIFSVVFFLLNLRAVVK